MKKSEQAKKIIASFKDRLAMCLGINIADIDIDVTCNKIPNKEMSQLKAEGLDIRIFDAGIGSMDTTLIEEGNTLIRFNGKYKSILFEVISECLKPDNDDELFERRREERILRENNNH